MEKEDLIPVRRRMLLKIRDAVLGAFAFFLRGVPVESEVWHWIREILTFLPGLIGMSLRVRFYNSYLKQSSPDLLILPGGYIEQPQYGEFGRHCTIGRNAWLAATGGLKVGNFVGIGPSVIIHTANHNFGDPNKPFLEQGHTLQPVVIENDVWLAAGVIVLPGTHIGEGAIIAAGSVVS